MNELGVFCGTFNPIHWGHLLIAEYARDQFQLNRVLFVTSNMPPHRHTDLLDGESRYEMVATAVANNPYFEASRLELERPGPSYTIDTLRELHVLWGTDTHLNLIVGADNIDSLSKWHEAEEIFRLCRLLVAPRTTKSESLSTTIKFNATIEQINSPIVSVSSSEIRQRIRQDKTVLYMVPSEVYAILLAKGHYLTPLEPASLDIDHD